MIKFSFYVISDAHRVLEKGKVVIDGKTLTIRKPNDDKNEEHGETKPEPEIEPTSEIMVLGVDPGLSVDVLEIFFENEDKSGGGPVKHVKLEKEWGTAVIMFEDHKGNNILSIILRLNEIF